VSGADDEVLPPAAFGRAFRAFLDASLAGVGEAEPELVRRVREHLGAPDPSALPVVGRDLARREHPNLKRGLLLHGPPGTGKTMTAMHLVGRMPGRTVVILSGEALGLIGPACDIARELEPATVILEDVDLVGHERGWGDPSAPLLFELLNEMDGLHEDADVLFLLTTNRPDELEPALAADEQGDGLVVEGRHLREALADLVIGTGEVKSSLFGAAPPDAAFPFPSPRAAGWTQENG